MSQRLWSLYQLPPSHLHPLPVYEMPRPKNSRRASTTRTTRQTRSKTHDSAAPSQRDTSSSATSSSAVDAEGADIGSPVLRRSTRTRTSGHPQAAQPATKRKPGYIYVPVEPDQADDLDPFDIPPPPKGSRVRKDRRRLPDPPLEIPAPTTDKNQDEGGEQPSTATAPCDSDGVPPVGHQPHVMLPEAPSSSGTPSPQKVS